MVNNDNEYCISLSTVFVRLNAAAFIKFSAFLMGRSFKVARYSFSGSVPPKFEHKLRRHKQSFGKIATTVVLDKDEKLL